MVPLRLGLERPAFRGRCGWARLERTLPFGTTARTSSRRSRTEKSFQYSSMTSSCASCSPAGGCTCSRRRRLPRATGRAHPGRTLVLPRDRGRSAQCSRRTEPPSNTTSRFNRTGSVRADARPVSRRKCDADPQRTSAGRNVPNEVPERRLRDPRLGQRSGMSPERDQLRREVLLSRTLLEVRREFCRLQFREARLAVSVPAEGPDLPPVVGVWG